ncbi:MAG TPA: 4a-hydroxytetrahydrobiopterin dehydratase [Acidobacteriota bacterium]
MPPLTPQQIKPLQQQLRGWEVVDNHHLRKQFKLADFGSALDLVNRVAEIAEKEDHHPDICFGWGKVEITIWTHKINGLTESDFILAAKIDAIS